MKYKEQIYRLLVSRVPVIEKRYQALRQKKRGKIGKMYAFAALLGMNLAWPICKTKWERQFYYPDTGKKPPTKVSESSLSARETPEDFAKRLAQYDIISFDVFDTLIFRPFSDPKDLFFLVGEALGQFDYKKLRTDMEKEARKKAYQDRGSYEVTLEEIYQELSLQAGIPMKAGMQEEIQAEFALNYANPYMLEVFHHLKQYEKRIICISDMYLSSKIIKAMLEKCGYSGIEEYFISCEHGVSKANGGLYRIAKEAMQKKSRIKRGKKMLTYVHIGDHPVSDIKQAKKQGFAAEWYRNINTAGAPYRAEDMSAVVGSLYRGTVNTWIHNGLASYSKAYELGFIYGGLFVLGYCQFIHECANHEKADKILFLSRDGEILLQVYGQLYPEETIAGRAIYAYWSRLAAAKLGAGYYKYDYFQRFLKHKMNQDYTIAQVFHTMELEDMLFDVCDAVGSLPEDTLTERRALAIQEYLMLHWETVLAHYQEQLSAAEAYYRQLLGESRHALAVDIGWAGSGSTILAHLIQEEWKLPCSITGVLAGTNTFHNMETDMGEAQRASGRAVSYLYSQSYNRELWKWHDIAKNHNLGVELLCTSAQGSLQGFYPSSLLFKQPDMDAATVRDIHSGIRDFVSLATRHWNCGLSTWQISGQDAYAPLKIFLSDTKELKKWVEGKIEVNL